MGGVHSPAVFQSHQVVLHTQQVVTGREEVAGIQHALIRDGSIEPVQGGGYPVGGFLVQVGTVSLGAAQTLGDGIVISGHTTVRLNATVDADGNYGVEVVT